MLIEKASNDVSEASAVKGEVCVLLVSVSAALNTTRRWSDGAPPAVPLRVWTSGPRQGPAFGGYTDPGPGSPDSVLRGL